MSLPSENAMNSVRNTGTLQSKLRSGESQEERLQASQSIDRSYTQEMQPYSNISVKPLQLGSMNNINVPNHKEEEQQQVLTQTYVREKQSMLEEIERLKFQKIDIERVLQRERQVYESDKQFSSIQQQQQAQHEQHEEVFNKNSMIQNLQKELEFSDKERKEQRTRVSQQQQECHNKDILGTEKDSQKECLNQEIVGYTKELEEKTSLIDKLLEKVDNQSVKNGIMQEEMKRSLCDAAVGLELKQENLTLHQEIARMREQQRAYETTEGKNQFGVAEMQKKHRQEINSIEQSHFEQLSLQKKESASVIARLEQDLDRLLEESHMVVLSRDDCEEKAQVQEQQQHGEEAKNELLKNTLKETSAECRSLQEAVTVLESKESVLTGELTEQRKKQRSMPVIMQRNTDLETDLQHVRLKLQRSDAQNDGYKVLVQYQGSALTDAWEQQFFAIDRVLEDNTLQSEQQGSVLSKHGVSITESTILAASSREEVKHLQKRIQRALGYVENDKLTTEELDASLTSLSCLIEDGLSASAMTHTRCVERSTMLLDLQRDMQKVTATQSELSREHAIAQQYASEKEYLRYTSDLVLATFMQRYLTSVEKQVQIQEVCEGKDTTSRNNIQNIHVSIPDYEVLTSKSVVEMNTTAFIKQARVHQDTDVHGSVKGICWLLGMDQREKQAEKQQEGVVEHEFHRSNNHAVQTHFKNIQTHLGNLPIPELDVYYSKIKHSFAQVAVLEQEKLELHTDLEHQQQKVASLQGDVTRLVEDLTACKEHRDELQYMFSSLTTEHTMKSSAFDRCQQDLEGKHADYMDASTKQETTEANLVELQSSYKAQEQVVAVLREECVTTQSKLTEHTILLEKTLQILKNVTEEKNHSNQTLASTTIMLENTLEEKQRLQDQQNSSQGDYKQATVRIHTYQRENNRLYILCEVLFTLFSASLLQQKTNKRASIQDVTSYNNNQYNIQEHVVQCDQQLKQMYSLFAPEQEYLPLASLPVSEHAKHDIMKTVQKLQRSSLRSVGYAIIAQNRFQQGKKGSLDLVYPMQVTVQVLERENTIDAFYTADKQATVNILQKSISKLLHKHTLHTELTNMVFASTSGDLQSKLDALEPQEYYQNTCYFDIGHACNMEMQIPSNVYTDQLTAVYIHIARNQAKVRGIHQDTAIPKRPLLSFIHRISAVKQPTETDRYKKERRNFVTHQKQQLTFLVDQQLRELLEQWSFCKMQVDEQFKHSYMNFLLKISTSVDYATEQSGFVSRVIKFVCIQYVSQVKQGKQQKHDLSTLREELQKQIETIGFFTNEKKTLEKRLLELGNVNKTLTRELETTSQALHALETQYSMLDHKSGNQMNELQVLQEKWITLGNSIETSKTVNRGLEAKVTDLQREQGMSKVELQGSKQECASLYEKLDSSKKIILALDTDIIETKKNITVITSEFQAVHEESNEWRRRFEGQHAESQNRDRRLGRTEDKQRQCTEEQETLQSQKEEMQASMEELIDQIHIQQSKTASTFLDAENQQLRTEIARLNKLYQESHSQQQNTRNVVTLLSSQVQDTPEVPVPMMKDILTTPPPQQRPPKQVQTQKMLGMYPPPLTVSNQTVNLADGPKEVTIAFNKKPKNSEWLDQALEKAQTTQFWLKEFK